MNRDETIQYIEKLIIEGQEVLSTKIDHCHDWGTVSYVDDDKHEKFKSQVGIFLSSNEKFKTSYNEFKQKVSYKTNYDMTKRYVSILNALKTSIESNVIILDNNNSEETSIENCVFVGHGHNKLWNEVIRFLKDDLKIEDVNYFERDSHAGRSIADALRDFRKETNFAIIVMTAEDETAQKTKRTRQNVIHEIGFFQGKLGFEKVAILKQDGVESFSNIDGLQYISFSENNISQTFYELQKMLKREGVIR